MSSVDPSGKVTATAGGPTVAISFVRLLSDYAESNGVLGEELLRSVGLASDRLQDVEQRLPLLQFAELCRQAARRLDDPHLGLSLGKAVKPGYLGAYGYLMMTCATLGEAMQRMMSFIGLVYDGFKFDLVIRGDEVVRTTHSVSPADRVDAIQEQLGLAATLCLARWISGREDLAPRWIRFRHPLPSDLQPYNELFRCAIEFGAAETEMACSLEHLQLPISQANAEVKRLMASLCEQAQERQRASLELPWLAACRRSIVDSLGHHEPRLADAALAAGCSERELQSRLSARGTRFRCLVDDLRRELALHYLDDSAMSLAEVAQLLGFAEQSVFQRAFKRWTGATPGEYRRQRGDGGG